LTGTVMSSSFQSMSASYEGNSFGFLLSFLMRDPHVQAGSRGRQGQRAAPRLPLAILAADMRIVTRFAMSADGYVTTPDGWPAHTADAAFGSDDNHGFQEFQRTLYAVLMGRT